MKEIEFEKMGSNLADAHGFKEVLVMMWKQTKPLFQKPLVLNFLRICYLAFSLILIAHGFYLWYVRFLSKSFSTFEVLLTESE